MFTEDLNPERVMEDATADGTPEPVNQMDDAVASLPVATRVVEDVWEVKGERWDGWAYLL